MKVRPRNDNVLVIIYKERANQQSSIVLPDSCLNLKYGPLLKYGEIVSVGPGCIDEEGRSWEPDFFRGETAVFDKHAGESWFVGDDVPHRCFPEYEPGTELRMLRFDEVLMVDREPCEPCPF